MLQYPSLLILSGLLISSIMRVDALTLKSTSIARLLTPSSNVHQVREQARIHPSIISWSRQGMHDERYLRWMRSRLGHIHHLLVYVCPTVCRLISLLPLGILSPFQSTSGSAPIPIYP
ncbi:hypothetical protein DFJ58DRAFT_760748 [Suillus subalutaceus]|uniref:uncharacterized protein n=1 Tax=Suillus subalutaceus TaxID=48586 RepID=UPI001B8654FC|nr:uncharacterized protein DFJ58DRAFT_760748 [Suillus subalutaceus]KAG1873020.1 hypothetical protein DFJ58DRAFT_760748 [Suillus subalutaceus]